MPHTQNHALEQTVSHQTATSHTEHNNTGPVINGNAYVNGTSNASEHVLARRPASHASSHPPEHEPTMRRFARNSTQNRLSDPVLLAHMGDQFQGIGADAAARLDLTGVVTESGNGVNGSDNNEAAHANH